MSDNQSDSEGLEIQRASIDVLALLNDMDLLKQADGLLTTDQFIAACKERGLDVFEEELEYYEQHGLLCPFLRAQRHVQWYTPGGQPADLGEDELPSPGMVPRYQSYSTDARNLLTMRDEGLLSQPTVETFQPWSEYRDAEAHYQARAMSYYVLYQILVLQLIKQHLIIREAYRRDENTDNNGNDTIVKYAKVLTDTFSSQDPIPHEVAELNGLVALLLVIQNRYRPGASGILSGYHRTADYEVYRKAFSPKAAWELVPIPVERIRTIRWLLCHRAKEMDPLVNWQDLVGYVGASKRWKLRGAALLAQEFYVVIDMLTQFLSDLAEERGETEPAYSCLGDDHYEKQVYGRKLNYWDYDILEHVLTDYDLNPRPKVLFVVEGDTEAAAIPIICEAMQVRLPTFGVELHNIAGVGKDLGVLTRYAGPPRLGGAIQPGVYAAVRQTCIFALLDREDTWRHDSKVEKLLNGWRAAVEQLAPDDLPQDAKEQIISQGVIVERWEQCFEFDNFSDSELAEAISLYARKWGWPEISAEEVAEYRERFPDRSLSKIVADKAHTMIAAGQDVPVHKDYRWNKVEVGMALARRLAERVALHVEGDPPEAPIVAILQRVVELALRNWP